MQHNAFAQFISSESGAVTVDWVVLTAATCLLGALFVIQIKGPQDELGVKIENSLTAESATLSPVNFE